MEEPHHPSASSSADDAAGADARENRLVDRRLSEVTVFLLDTAVKAISIIFWYFVFSPIFRIWKH